MVKPDLIVLCHRIPYPPNKGDKIRSYQFLKFLSTQFNVHLATYVDDAADEKYVAYVESLCVSSCIERVKSGAKIYSALISLFSGQAVTVTHYRSRKIERWLQDLNERLDSAGVFCISSPMARFLKNIQLKKTFSYIDYIDVDSAKWSQLATESRGLFRWIYSREARLLKAYENQIGKDFDKLLFVSKKEAETFLENNRHTQELLDDSGFQHKVAVLSNGVDTDFFDPGISFIEVYPKNERIIVFTGVMNYQPNEDAVSWFSRECMPTIKRAIPNAVFYVVGAKPSGFVTNLASEFSCVRVVGAVQDIRPYIKQAHVVVAPLRLGRGIQNKVLEALAFDKPLVASANALAGIDENGQLGAIVAQDSSQFSTKVIDVLRQSVNGVMPSGTLVNGFCGRTYVIEHFSWQDRYKKMEEIFNRKSAQ
ncbi:MAG: TIGR03087 family PEP-CTERM/XrtA system glycosyltransferase [Hahellaceae bacterium]|nr:TIGR03087 family PEP-CTERM/XrtA system glycosyltransferase [Hahellaceae bacterium]